MQMDSESLSKFIDESKGWVPKLEEAQTHASWLPSGFTLMTASNQDVSSLRWGVSSDQQDTSRVLDMGEATLASFPEYQNASQPLGYFESLLRDDRVCEQCELSSRASWRRMCYHTAFC